MDVAVDNSEDKLNKIDNLEITEKKHNEPEIDEDGFEMVKPRKKK